MKRSAAVFESLDKTKEDSKPKPKSKSINYNEENVNAVVGHVLTSTNQLKQLMFNLHKWNVRHTIKVIGDPVEETANSFLMKIARVHDPFSYTDIFKPDYHWADKQRPSVDDYLKKGIIDGPTDGRGNKDTFFHVFVTQEIRLTKEQEDKLTEFDKDIIHWTKQNDPKHFFYYWFRRKHFVDEKEEQNYEDEESEFLKKKQEADEDVKELKGWVEMASLYKELQAVSGPAPQNVVDDLAKLRLENQNTMETKYVKNTNGEFSTKKV